MSRSLIDKDDTTRRFVRFHRATAAGFVEFSFGLGSTELMVDLVLPLGGYREFCQTNRVELLTSEEEVAMDHEQAKWRYGKPGAVE